MNVDRMRRHNDSRKLRGRRWTAEEVADIKRWAADMADRMREYWS